MPDFEEILVEYFRKTDLGVAVDPREIIRSNPDHAEKLTRFFENMHLLNAVVDQIAREDDMPSDELDEN